MTRHGITSKRRSRLEAAGPEIQNAQQTAGWETLKAMAPWPKFTQNKSLQWMSQCIFGVVDHLSPPNADMSLDQVTIDVIMGSVCRLGLYIAQDHCKPPTDQLKMTTFPKCPVVVDFKEQPKGHQGSLGRLELSPQQNVSKREGGPLFPA